MNVGRLQMQLRELAQERDWVQFHTPKNLVMALSVEASELVEVFQWLTPEESQQVMEGPRAKGVSDEVADIMIYLLRLTDVLGVDLDSVIAAKLARMRAGSLPSTCDG